LNTIKQAGGKIVQAWAIEADCDPARLQSNRFAMEWPPKSGQTRDFPEVDRAGWFTPAEARTKILAGQIPFIDQLVSLAESGLPEQR
jgi:predicted NUDIX family NTP pyrophosphohydrolase